MLRQFPDEKTEKSYQLSAISSQLSAVSSQRAALMHGMTGES
jgi:hypothetical protein